MRALRHCSAALAAEDQRESWSSTARRTRSTPSRSSASSSNASGIEGPRRLRQRSGEDSGPGQPAAGGADHPAMRRVLGQRGDAHAPTGGAKVFRETNGWAAFGYRSRRIVINTNLLSLASAPAFAAGTDQREPGREEWPWPTRCSAPPRRISSPCASTGATRSGKPGAAALPPTNRCWSMATRWW